MVKFEDALDVSPLDNGKDWKVLENFYYDTDVVLTPAPRVAEHGIARQPGVEVILSADKTVSWRIIIEKDFITDFASIPRPLWALVGGPADGKYRKIAAVHDKLYRTLGLCTRAQADAVLLEGMKFCGCSWYQRTMIYSGVRVGGMSSYKGGL